MRILVSTFGQDDFDKVVQAMRQLPYERLVLMGTPEAVDSKAFARIKDLEEVTGHFVSGEIIPESGFMEIVDEISDLLSRCSKDVAGRKNEIALNISGGNKLQGDAALFAAFRLGIETYHCDERITKLPILKGLTAKDRFTPSQIKFLYGIRQGSRSFDDIVEETSPGKRQAAERVMRELRKAGLILTTVEAGKITVSLSGQGVEVVRAVNSH